MTSILTHTGVPIKKDNIKKVKKIIYTKNILNEIMDPLKLLSCWVKQFPQSVGENDIIKEFPIKLKINSL